MINYRIFDPKEAPGAIPCRDCKFVACSTTLSGRKRYDCYHDIGWRVRRVNGARGTCDIAGRKVE